MPTDSGTFYYKNVRLKWDIVAIVISAHAADTVSGSLREKRWECPMPGCKGAKGERGDFGPVGPQVAS